MKYINKFVFSNVILKVESDKKIVIIKPYRLSDYDRLCAESDIIKNFLEMEKEGHFKSFPEVRFCSLTPFEHTVTAWKLPVSKLNDSFYTKINNYYLIPIHILTTLKEQLESSGCNEQLLIIYCESDIDLKLIEKEGFQL